MSSVPLDAYVLDTLMRDLVSHDRSASSYIVYLHLWRRTLGSGKERVRVSLQRIADATGLSKSAVQGAVRNLTRRRLLRASKASTTAVPEYAVLRPWRRDG
jgi:DNA-binding GntR family transcriptional regulator